VLFLLTWGDPPTPPEDLFVAVLPFEDLSGDAKFAYFAEGIAAEVRATLTRHQRGMRIAGTATSLQLKSNPRDHAAIHKAVGTTHIVDGSVRREGMRVRIIAQLTDARDGSLLWSGTYERSFEQALDIQSDVARQVAAALNLATPVMTDEEVRIPPQVLKRYLYAMQILRDGVIAHTSVPEAVENLKTVVRESPQFARGWAALAMAYVELGRRQDEQQQAETMTLARSAAAKAADLDPQLAAAHAALSRVQSEWSWRARYTHLQRALALAPGDVDVMLQWSAFLFAIGRDKEHDQVEREVLSLDPMSAFSQFKLMMRAIWVGDFAAAEERLHKRVAENPRAAYFWIRYFWGHVNAGHVAEARKALSEIERNWPVIQAMNTWTTDVARKQLDLLREAQTLVAPPDAIKPYGIKPDGVKQWYEQALSLTAGPLRGQGCVLMLIEGLFDKEWGHPELGWRTVDELYVKRGFVGTVATCPVAAHYNSFGNGQAVFPERQAPTWAFWDRHWDHRDPRSWRLFATVGLAQFWLETGRWPDFCSDPNLPSYDCKAEAQKALAQSK
jgi:TolB-like protein/Tfp pilus assembly protein PilF